MGILALVIVSVAAVGCADDSAGMPAGTNTPYADAKTSGVTVTNMYRQMNGKPPLTESAALVAYADTGANEDFSGMPHQHFSETSGGGIAFAENECPHWSLAQEGSGDMTKLVAACIAAFYAEGPGSDYATHGHYINMMGNYATLGLGIKVSGDEVTLIEDFGN